MITKIRMMMTTILKGCLLSSMCANDLRLIINSHVSAIGLLIFAQIRIRVFFEGVDVKVSPKASRSPKWLVERNRRCVRRDKSRRGTAS